MTLEFGRILTSTFGTTAGDCSKWEPLTAQLSSFPKAPRQSAFPLNFRRNNLGLLGWLKKDAGQGSWLPPQSLEIFIIFQSSVTEVIGNMTASHAIRVAEGEGGSLAPRAGSSALFSALFCVVAISILFLTCWISRRQKIKQTNNKKYHEGLWKQILYTFLVFSQTNLRC